MHIRAGLFCATGVALSLAALPARAQFAVIDVASVAQLIQQLGTMAQQLETAQAELSQVQALYRGLNGSRGMQQLLSGTNRNYLPTDGSQLGAALDGSGAYPDLAAAVEQGVRAHAVLSDAQLAALPLDHQQAIVAERRAVALQQALAQSALSNSSQRFGSIQQLIDAIGSASDEKAVQDLQARIAAEQGMLQNEQTKLQSLYQAAQSQHLSDEQQQREQALAALGRFTTRFEPTPR